MSDAKAAEWMEKGKVALTKFRWPWSTEQKWEEASECFTKAANLYKMSKKWELAGEAFMQSAECHLNLCSKHEAASNYINAANCYKKCNTSDAVKCLKMGVEFYVDEGRFSIAAKYQKDIAELYETEMHLDEAIEGYQQAADFYEGEGSTSAANSCLLKVAQFSAQLERYDKAIELYEQVASASVDNKLLKWSVKEYFMKACLCYLAKGIDDLHATKQALDRYKDMDSTFGGTRECTLLENIVEACEEFDVEKFTAAVADFDSISRLDNWKTAILLKVKNSIKEADDNDLLS